MNIHKFRIFIFKFLRAIVTPFYRLKFNYSYDRIDVKAPYVFVCNHVTNYDPLFIGIAEKDFVYFVSTENLTRMGLFSKIIMFLFNPIIHYKGKTGVSTVMEMLKYLKQGYNVGVFPEGNRTFNGRTNSFVSTIGKVIKKSGASLVTYRIQGGYFTQPRWSVTLRKGKVHGTLVHVYSPEELEKMDKDEVNKAIERDLYVDAYEIQNKTMQRYRGKKLAYGLESCLFLCPECHSINTLSSEGNTISCSCGYKATYDEYGYVGGKTITELDDYQHKFINENDVFFEDKVNAQIIDENHDVADSYPCLLSADKNGFYLNGEKLNLEGLDIHTRNTLIVHTKDILYNFKGSVGFNALKYKYLYEKN